MDPDEDGGRVLSDEECWELLRDEELGRLAFRLVDEVHIVPINFAVDGRTLLFRTEAGDKLFSVALGAPVAFEIDRIETDDDGDHAQSVVIRGRARVLEEDEAHRAEVVPLRPWVGSHKYNVVEITPEHLSGRRYTLSRPWLRMIPPEASEG
jgi:uncharacterized protein